MSYFEYLTGGWSGDASSALAKYSGKAFVGCSLLTKKGCQYYNTLVGYEMKSMRSQRRSIVEEMKCCAEKMKHRDEKEYKDLINRLSRVEGQVRGVKKMVEEERYCVDILTQVLAVQAALNAFNKKLLANHIHSCVVDDIKEGNMEVVDELCDTIQKIMK